MKSNWAKRPTSIFQSSDSIVQRSAPLNTGLNGIVQIHWIKEREYSPICIIAIEFLCISLSELAGHEYLRPARIVRPSYWQTGFDWEYVHGRSSRQIRASIIV